jgi:uncharacterized protein with NAD-binding domain and iron-sulfur cluster
MDTRGNGPKKSVIVIGGGVGGLTAADELIRRGFDVHVYERRPSLGGKARSLVFSPDDRPGLNLPAEHGFRFFPAFYKHVIATMKRIPCEGSPDGTVYGNLEKVRQLRALGDVKSNPVLGVLPVTPLWRSPSEWVAYLPSFLEVSPIDGKRLTGADLAFFARRIWAFLTMCTERREADLEGMSWSNFIGKGRSSVYQKYLAVGLTRNLVACKADKASALTVGTIGLQLLLDVGASALGSSTLDRVLNGPTDIAWIEPWKRHLERQGVVFHAQRALHAIEMTEDETGPRIGRLLLARPQTGPEALSGDPSVVDARARELAKLPPERAHEQLAERPAQDLDWVQGDFYVFAIPVEQMATFITPQIAAADPAWGGLAELAKNVEWMNGVLFYMDKEDEVPTAHTDCLDSDWALTSIDQGPKLWPRWLELRGSPDVQRIISVDVSDWTTARSRGPNAGKSASELPRHEVIEETWAQVKAATAGRFGYEVDDAARRYSFVDDDIQERLNVRKILTFHRSRAAAAVGAQPLLTNAEPLLVNQVGSRKLRPEASGSVANAFLASDYVKTVTDLATMEGANEAARRAVNGILRKESRQDFCKLFPLSEPLGFLRTWDRRRFRRSLPPSPIVAAMGVGVGAGFWLLLRGSQVTNWFIRLARRMVGAPPRVGEVVAPNRPSTTDAVPRRPRRGRSSGSRDGRSAAAQSSRSP